MAVGSHIHNGRTYSDDANGYGQHYLITTAFNRCDLYHEAANVIGSSIIHNCGTCAASRFDGPVLYCYVRVEET